MSDELHYRFSPASAYRLNRCLYALKSDAAFRERFVANPEATLTDAGLDAEERALVLAGDRDGLAARGAHAYLVFMASLRLSMERGTATFEYF